MNMMHEVRKALDDITKSFKNYQYAKANMQAYLLRKMIDEQPSRQKPWSDYQGIIDEEWGIVIRPRRYP